MSRSNCYAVALGFFAISQVITAVGCKPVKTGSVVKDDEDPWLAEFKGAIDSAKQELNAAGIRVETIDLRLPEEVAFTGEYRDVYVKVAGGQPIFAGQIELQRDFNSPVIDPKA